MIAQCLQLWWRDLKGTYTQLVKDWKHCNVTITEHWYHYLQPHHGDTRWQCS